MFQATDSGVELSAQQRGYPHPAAAILLLASAVEVPHFGATAAVAGDAFAQLEAQMAADDFAATLATALEPQEELRARLQRHDWSTALRLDASEAETLLGALNRAYVALRNREQGFTVGEEQGLFHTAVEMGPLTGTAAALVSLLVEALEG